MNDMFIDHHKIKQILLYFLQFSFTIDRSEIEKYLRKD
jgi:hypothetical protein